MRGFDVKEAGSNLIWWSHLLIFCFLWNSNMHLSKFTVRHKPFTPAMATANVLSLSNSLLIWEVCSTPLFLFFFSFLSSADHHTGWGPWLTVREAEETCHSSSYQRVRGAISFSPPPSSSSFSSTFFLPPSILSRYLFNGRVTSPPSQLFSTPENPQVQSKRTTLHTLLLLNWHLLHLRGVWHASSLQLSDLH